MRRSGLRTRISRRTRTSDVPEKEKRVGRSLVSFSCICQLKCSYKKHEPYRFVQEKRVGRSFVSFSCICQLKFSCKYINPPGLSEHSQRTLHLFWWQSPRRRGTSKRNFQRTGQDHKGHMAYEFGGTPRLSLKSVKTNSKLDACRTRSADNHIVQAQASRTKHILPEAMTDHDNEQIKSIPSATQVWIWRPYESRTNNLGDCLTPPVRSVNQTVGCPCT